MREIKYKIWNNKLKSFSFVSKQNYLGSVGIIDSLVDGENSIWLQYTGLKDKNGVEIYEGNIVRCVGYQQQVFNATIIFDSERAKFDINKFDDLENFTNKNNQWSLEVIGNIYENPELITT